MQRECPKCGSEDVAEIIYGYIPNLTDDLARDLEAGKIILGGCCIEPGSPRRQCKKCNHQWGKVQL